MWLLIAFLIVVFQPIQIFCSSSSSSNGLTSQYYNGSTILLGTGFSQTLDFNTTQLPNGTTYAKYCGTFDPSSIMGVGGSTSLGFYLKLLNSSSCSEGSSVLTSYSLTINGQVLFNQMSATAAPTIGLVSVSNSMLYNVVIELWFLVNTNRGGGGGMNITLLAFPYMSNITTSSNVQPVVATFLNGTCFNSSIRLPLDNILNQGGYQPNSLYYSVRRLSQRYIGPLIQVMRVNNVTNVVEYADMWYSTQTQAVSSSLLLAFQANSTSFNNNNTNLVTISKWYDQGPLAQHFIYSGTNMVAGINPTTLEIVIVNSTSSTTQTFQISTIYNATAELFTVFQLPVEQDLNYFDLVTLNYNPHQNDFQSIVGMVIPNPVNTPLNAVFAVCTDMTGNLYMSDIGNTRIIRYFKDSTLPPELIVNTFGIGASYGLAIDGNNNLLVVDTYNNRIIVFYPNLTTILTIIEFVNNSFSEPNNIALDNQNNIYLADGGNTRWIKIWANYSLDMTVFNDPTGVAIDNMGNLYTADPLSNSVSKFNSITGVQLALYTNASNIAYPNDVAVDISIDRLYIANNEPFNNIFVLAASTFTYVETLSSFGLSRPFALNMDISTPHQLIIADTGNGRVLFVNTLTNAISKIITLSTNPVWAFNPSYFFNLSRSVTHSALINPIGNMITMNNITYSNLAVAPLELSNSTIQTNITILDLVLNVTNVFPSPLWNGINNPGTSYQEIIALNTLHQWSLEDRVLFYNYTSAFYTTSNIITTTASVNTVPNIIVGLDSNFFNPSSSDSTTFPLLWKILIPILIILLLICLYLLYCYLTATNTKVNLTRRQRIQRT